MLGEHWSSEHIVGWSARVDLLTISSEMIYRHIWADKKRGACIATTLSQRPRKRFGSCTPEKCYAP